MICLDYGDKRIGVAVSDIDWQIASPLVVLQSHGCFNGIFEIINEYCVLVVVVGLPISLGGKERGAQLEKVKKFIEKLNELIEKKNIDVVIYSVDERFSTVAANRILENSGLSRTAKKRHVDKVAASFILQGVLDRFI
ncbi:MAG: Holliday junction resolvase RuvX [Holosporales bacterium]|nr:Holliday junction resolvase RuvX [Holosporales bacterium]